MINAHSFLRAISALAFPALLIPRALAAPPSEPSRFFDIGKGRFVFNPDYR
jgi:hypothetical protein